MSKNKDNLETKLSEAKMTANALLSKSKKKATAVEVAKTRSTKDIILWLLAVVALISATLVNEHLPAYWQLANDMWVRVGIIIALIVFAFVCLAFTNQGSAFKVLLKDAGVELRRVTWPSKQETFQYTWQVLLVIAIVAVFVWLLDNVFNWLVGLFIG